MAGTRVAGVYDTVIRIVLIANLPGPARLQSHAARAVTPSPVPAVAL